MCAAVRNEIHGSVSTHPWAFPSHEVVRRFDVNPLTGLSTEEATRRLTAIGPNTVAVEPPRSVSEAVLARFRSPVTLGLVGLAAVAAGAGSAVGAGPVIGPVAVALTTLTDVAIEVGRERRALRRLATLCTAPPATTRVRRDDRAVEVPTGELVPGDILLLTPGDVVGADARLLGAHGLHADEQALTGDRRPSPRVAVPVSAGAAPLVEQRSMVHAGTRIVRGTGTAVVVATGALGTLGRVAGQLARPEPPITRRRLPSRLGSLLSVLVAAGVATGSIAHLLS